MTERVDFASLSLPQQHFPPEAKPSGILREKSTAWGVQIQHHLVLSCSFSRELLQVIILATQRGAGVIQHCSITVKEGRAVAGQLDHFEELPVSCTCSLAARYPAASPCFSWSHNCSRECVILWKAVGKSDRPGFDVSSWGTHLSSPQILPCQISVSGWRWSLANNNSIALCGVKSAEESTITWKKGDEKQQVKKKGPQVDHSTNEL